MNDERGYSAGCPMCADLKTEAGKVAFALTIGWPLPEEMIAVRRALVEERERTKALKTALGEVYSVLCDLEPMITTKEQAALVLRAIAFCKYDKQPEWNERIAALEDSLSNERKDDGTSQR